MKDIEDALDQYVAGQRKAMRALPELDAGSGAQIAEIERATRQVIDLVQREILSKETPTIDAAVYLKEVSAPREVVQKAATQQDLLSRQLQRRVDDARNERLKTLAAVLALLGLGVAIAVVTVRNITATVAGLQDSVERVRGGEYRRPAADRFARRSGRPGPHGELAAAGAHRGAVQSEEAARRAEAENETLNNSVISILEAVNQLSQRDLTARAPVTQDIIGTVSDSINALTDETAKVLRTWPPLPATWHKRRAR